MGLGEVADSVVFSLHTTCKHACSSPRQPHPLRRGGERCNSSPLPCWLLRQSDWPRLLKMDLEHLPFIAFPLPLPDVTAEHDFPGKKKKVLLPFPTLGTIERRRSCRLFCGPRRSFSITLFFCIAVFSCIFVRGLKRETISGLQSSVDSAATTKHCARGTSSSALKTVASVTHTCTHRLKRPCANKTDAPKTETLSFYISTHTHSNMPYRCLNMPF